MGNAVCMSVGMLVGNICWICCWTFYVICLNPLSVCNVVSPNDDYARLLVVVSKDADRCH